MTPSSEKRRFLVVYDYGQGGVWAFVRARSEDEVHRVLSDVSVVDSTPSWLTGDELRSIEESMTFDIDELTPEDWISRLRRTD